MGDSHDPFLLNTGPPGQSGISPIDQGPRVLHSWEFFDSFQLHGTREPPPALPPVKILLGEFSSVGMPPLGYSPLWVPARYLREPPSLYTLYNHIHRE